MKRIIISTLVLTLGLGSCKMADIRTDSIKNNASEALQTQKGKKLLKESVLAMGYQNLEKFEVYSVKNEFNWHYPWTAMPLNSLPGNKNKEAIFRFDINSFDGQIEYMEGRKKGDVHGIQSWKSYEKKNDNALEFDKDSRRNWGIASYHYMLEAPYRLLNAPIIKYAGEKEFEGRQYDLIFVSWGKDEPHKKHDQWLVYINKVTKFVDLTQLTIRDFWMPFPPNMAQGTVRYLERKETNGIHFPTELSIQLIAPKKESNYVYKITLWDYQFDSFNKELLYPNPNLPKLGDEKLADADE